MRQLAAVIVLGSGVLSGILFAEPKVRSVHLPPVGSIPDLTQTDPRGKFMDGGRNFCGPVAVSNSLWAMFGAEYEFEDFTQHDLVNKLASLSYMNTDREKGTGVRQLIRGVENYLSERGEKKYYLRFQGWRRHDNRHRTGVTEPRLTWIKAILEKEGGAVWLNVGWYRETPDDGPLKRIGGHWVTAVGYGKDAEGAANPDYLVIHDPSPRAGQPGPEFVKMTRIQGGVLTGVMRNLPRPARNLYLMEGGMHVKRGAQHAILDGAVGLILNPGAKAKAKADSVNTKVGIGD